MDALDGVTAPAKAFLAFPHNGSVRAEFLCSLLQALNDPQTRIGEVYPLQSGPVMGIGRTVMAQAFLESKWDWLWMVDTDMVFTPRTLPLLMDAADPEERPVMGALCWAFNQEGLVPTLYRAAQTSDGRFGFAPFPEIPNCQVTRVAATGAACLLIHRSVFKRLDEANPADAGMWFAAVSASGREFSEDFSFCFRCHEAGVPVHVHTGVQAGHVKPYIFGAALP